MKQLTKSITYKTFATFLMLFFIQTILWAQDNSSSSTTTSTTKISTSGGGDANWYNSPWVWIVGAALFILLLVALTSGGRKTGNSNTERVTVTKTVSRDADTDAV